MMADVTPVATAPTQPPWLPWVVAILSTVGAGYGADTAVQRQGASSTQVREAVTDAVRPLRTELRAVARRVEAIEAEQWRATHPAQARARQPAAPAATRETGP